MISLLPTINLHCGSPEEWCLSAGILSVDIGPPIYQETYKPEVALPCRPVEEGTGQVIEGQYL